MKHFYVLFFGLIVLFGSAQKSPLDLADSLDFSDFALYAPHLNQYKVFVNGENHAYTKSNAQLQLKMFKYLHQQAGVKHLLLELGWSRGYVITQYIQTGDTTLLPAIKSFSWKYYADLVEGLKRYNDGLPDSAKITVTGIDVERHYSMAFKALSLVLPDTPLAHDSIAVSVQSVHSAVAYLETAFAWDEAKGGFGDQGKNTFSMEQTVFHLLKNVQAHQQKFLEIVKPKDHQTFLKIISQLKGRQTYLNYESDNALQSYVYREKYMYDQFLELHQRDTTQKYFMQFGRCHSIKTIQQEACGWYRFKSIAHQINQTSALGLEGSVLSTGIYYPLSEQWTPLNEAEKNRVKEVYLKGSAPNELTLWEVNTDSVFRERNNFLIVNNKPLQTESDPKNKLEKSFETADNYRFGFLNLTTGGAFLSRPTLSQYLADSNYDAYSRTFFFGVQLGAYRQNGLYYAFEFTSPIAQRVVHTQDLTLRVNTYLYHFSVGYDLLPNEALFLIPYLGMGGNSVKLKARSTSTASLLGEEVNSRVIGTNLNATLGFKFQKESKGTIFGLDLKYSKDIGNTLWVANKTILENGIQLNAQGLVLGGFVGFWF